MPSDTGGTHKNEDAARRRVKKYGLLYVDFLLYSFIGLLAKLAGGYPLVSWPAAGLYGACFCILGLYALIWQQVLKYMPLNIAYPNKAVTIPLGMLWGALFFNETVSWNKAVGAAVVICGVFLVVARHD